MLIQQLRDLGRDGIVRRVVHPMVPPKVDYSLTPGGEELCPALDELLFWAQMERSADVRWQAKTVERDCITAALGSIAGQFGQLQQMDQAGQEIRPWSRAHGHKTSGSDKSA